jgi:hypothetical protein
MAAVVRGVDGLQAGVTHRPCHKVKNPLPCRPRHLNLGDVVVICHTKRLDIFVAASSTGC